MKLAVPVNYAGSQSHVATTVATPSDSEDTPWWLDYHDAVLGKLMTRALSNNPEIEQALARLREAEAIDSTAWTRFVPTADLTAGGGHGTGSDPSRARAGSVMSSADNTKTLTQVNAVGGVEATWQIDLTGKIANQVNALHANTEGLRAAREFLVSRLTSDITQSYLIIRGLQANAALLQHSRQLTENLYALIESRYKLGLASELELAQVRRDREKTRADEQTNSVQLTLAMNRLAALVGDYRANLEPLLNIPQPVPVAGGEIKAGLPVDLLKNRGDVRFAELKVVAAKAERRAQMASLFPSVAITAAAGEQRQDNGLMPLLSQHIWSVGPSVFWPILDFGSLDAAIEVARLKEHEALVAYKAQVQQAVSDVEAHADAYQRSTSRVHALETAVAASQESTKLTLSRYQNGLTDYLHVIDALRQEDLIAREYSDALVQMGSEWAVLQTSLGQGSRAIPISDHPFVPKPAVMAIFTNLFHHTEP